MYNSCKFELMRYVLYGNARKVHFLDNRLWQYNEINM